MQMRRIMFGILGGLGLLLASTSPAKATIDWQLSSLSGDVYTYSIAFTPKASEALVAGDFTTLFDFAGLTNANQVSGSILTNFTPSVQPLGEYAFAQMPPQDLATVNNLTLTYKAGSPTLTTTTTLGTVTITGGLAANLVSPVNGFYSGQSTDTSVSPGAFGNSGGVQVPGAGTQAPGTVPAPASVVMLGLGMGILGIARLRRRLLKA